MAENVPIYRGGQYEINIVLCCKIVLGKNFCSSSADNDGLLWNLGIC